MVKRMIDKMDFSALHGKLQKAKELFYLLDERREGHIKLDDLMIELRSGGISPEHEQIIIDKFFENGCVQFDCILFISTDGCSTAAM